MLVGNDVKALDGLTIYLSMSYLIIKVKDNYHSFFTNLN
jgi:hypothetical protein